ncbi:TonB-dependent receptor [Kordiimonas gwangyangensis]|uniref:TonB-dependent receptor n=1 Tax=Kordiimonas gwangyangensis TaxID=288022 RepID=UPI0003A160EC|nr:TonB-dependent receptor [Kordiimonas gwangyangensis]
MRLYHVGAPLLSAVSTAAILFAVPAYAQDSSTENNLLEMEEIVVSSSRIKKSGFEAPTPVTVLGGDDLAARGATNVADIVNELPGFTGTITPTATVLNSRGSATNVLDLRGLGGNRNLVLVNGRRHVPTDEFGVVDINVVPTLAVSRIEVVTGGASAAWGSDAISGVIDIRYDDQLEGLKAEAQYGISDEGDNENYRVSLAFGANVAEGRGHVLIAADYNESKGLPDARGREWSREHWGIIANPDDTGPNDGIAANMFAPDVKLFIASPNGVTLPDGTALGNLEFMPGGTAVSRQLGDVIGGVFMTGGSGAYFGDQTALAIPLERKNIMAAFNYEVAEGLNFYFEGNAGQSASEGALIDSFIFGETIKSGNPYLPDSVQAEMDASGTDSISLYRTNSEFGAITSVSKTQNLRFVAGFDGEFSNGWTWDVYYQYGRVDFSNQQTNNMIPGNLSLAADVVTDPVTGEAVCASALSGQNPNCVPINLFGVGSPSAAAIDYVTGTSISDTKLRQDVVAATVNGDLFEGWTGPISTAFGVEYRKESLKREVDDVSEQAGFLITNAQPLEGEYNVKEGFGEVLVPLLNTDTGQSLSFNGAVRYTDYSTSGTVLTWKTGLTFDPIEELRLRGTISRDIRAPSIGEVFLKTLLLFENIENPFTGNVDFTKILNTGNSDLQEERALTKTFGVVYSPNWLEGLRLSVDWYDIGISDAIQSISSSAIVQGCFEGDDAFCDLVAFEPDNTIASVTNRLLNLGTYDVRGLDFEAQYQTVLNNGATLGVKLLGSYVYDKNIAPDGANEENYAGDVGAENIFGLPKWKARGNVAYQTEKYGLFANVRYVGAGKYNVLWGPEQLSDEDNNISAQVYVDLSAQYQLREWIEVYAGVNNVLDNDPPVAPLDFISPQVTNPVHYDVVGRSFYFGVRTQF